MAINQREVDLGPVVEKNRTFRVTIDSPFNSDFHISAHRELVRYTEDPVDLITHKRGMDVRRKLSDVMSETVTLSLTGTETLSVAQIAEAIELFVDAWTSEDIAAAEAAADAASSTAGQ